MINRYLLLLIVLTGLSSCAAEVRLPFEIMDETELAWYNASSSFDEQIICREQIEHHQNNYENMKATHDSNTKRYSEDIGLQRITTRLN